jgi:hypothetical protein
VHVASAARPEAQPLDLTAGVEVQFRWGTRASLRTDHPLAKAVFLTLGEAWPEALAFDDLLARATQRTSAAADDDGAAALERIVLAGFGLRMVDVASEPWRSVSIVSDRPHASAVARLESETRVYVTSPLHRAASLDDPAARRVLQLCDGTRSEPEILTAFAQDNHPLAARELTEQLHRMARLGLLVT